MPLRPLIFFLAVIHTFLASRFTQASHRAQARHDARQIAAGLPPRPSVAAEMLHFFGEIEVVFGLWTVPLIGAILAMRGWNTATHYVNDTVNYTEPLFVVVIMALASTRPIIMLAESWLRALARIGGGTPGAWWLVILTVAPLLGSFITEPAAMTIAALLLARQFYDLNPSPTLEVRDARTAVRQRLDRRHADPFCRAAGPDGGAHVGMGHAVHARPLRLARGHRDRVSTLAYYLLFRKRIRGARGGHGGARGRKSRRRMRKRAGRCCRSRRGSRWCTSGSWPGPW